MDVFINIEKLVRRLWESKFGDETASVSRRQPRFRQMLEALLAKGIISGELYERLLGISGHRNVVVHGHVDSVDPVVFQEAQGALRRLAEIESNEDHGRSKMPPT